MTGTDHTAEADTMVCTMSVHVTSTLSEDDRKNRQLENKPQGGYSPERWRPIREGENTLLGLFFVKNVRNARYVFRGFKWPKTYNKGYFEREECS